MLKKRKRLYLSLDIEVYNKLQKHCIDNCITVSRFLEKALLTSYPQFKKTSKSKKAEGSKTENN